MRPITRSALLARSALLLFLASGGSAAHASEPVEGPPAEAAPGAEEPIFPGDGGGDDGGADDGGADDGGADDARGDDAGEASILDVLDAAEDGVRRQSGADETAHSLRQPDPRRSTDTRIIEVGRFEWVLAESLREAYAHDLEALKELARPRQHHGPDGAPDGWEIRLERFGLLHQAGFRNGDVVHAVNGRTLESWPAVYAAWRDLRREDRWVVRVTRRDGRELKLVYTIR